MDANLSSDLKNKLKNSIKNHEGYRKFPYKDTKGKETIGWGRNLKDVGVCTDEAEIMLENDIQHSAFQLFVTLPFTKSLDEVRQAVLIEMVFTMGMEKLITFTKMINALKQNDFNEASLEMINSDWDAEAKGRVTEMAHWMKTGVM